ncbi:MAG TPA: hypothetical protein VNL13_05670 [Sulfolobales archaeon]|nr:hypothetical protein [Sulfolobales archaeon]
MARLRTIDLGDLSILCSTSRIGEIRRRVVEILKPGEEAVVVTRDPETWYALTNLGDELGYELIESSRDSEGRYLVRIRMKNS